LNFIRKQYFPSLPEDFKIWEKDGNNNVRLIFSGYMDDVFDPKKKFEKMSEDSLLKTLEDLVARRNRILSEAKTKGEQSQLSAEIDIQIADAWCAARDKNLSKEKIENLLSQIKDVESLVEKIKGDYFDEHMSEETDKQVDFLKSDGLSLTNEP
jgi:RNA polymerase-binding transcription factor DksA